MKKILIHSPQGDRLVAPNERFVLGPDEVVVGLQDDGRVGLGDVVAGVTKLFGAKLFCARCNKTRKKWNKIRLPKALSWLSNNT
jgi:hypothetical protein